VQGVTLDAVSFCNLSDAGGGAWAHAPTAGHVSIDPALGRIAFGSAPATAPLVTWHRGFAADLGGGGYDRLASFQNLQPVIAVPSGQRTVQAGVNAAAQGGAVQIADSGLYAETVAINPTGAGAFVELRAADQVAPFLVLGGDLLISGADGTDVCLNGLWIAGGRVRVPASAANKLRRLTLRHCTLTPGIARNTDGSAAQPDAPSLVIETAVEVVIENCILGGVRAAPGASVSISDSIVDAGQPAGVAYAALDGAAAGAPLSALRVTMIGKARATQLVLASDAIFVASLSTGDTWAAPVLADRRSVGCARFSYFPPGARTPRRYQCQPAAGADPIVTQPVFASLRFGDPGYCQLSARTPREIRNGAEDGGEMGAFQSLAQARRETNLRARLAEHLRFGIDASVAYVT
jgi:hypothetical protein